MTAPKNPKMFSGTSKPHVSQRILSKLYSTEMLFLFNLPFLSVEHLWKKVVAKLQTTCNNGKTLLVSNDSTIIHDIGPSSRKRLL